MQGLASISQASPASLGEQLAAWSRGQEARAATKLHLTSFPFTDEQKETIEEAVSRALPRVTGSDAPNRRALALVEVCRDWLQGRGFSEERQPRCRRKRTPSVSATATPQTSEE